MERLPHRVVKGHADRQWWAAVWDLLSGVVSPPRCSDSSPVDIVLLFTGNLWHRWDFPPAYALSQKPRLSSRTQRQRLTGRFALGTRNDCCYFTRAGRFMWVSGASQKWDWIEPAESTSRAFGTLWRLWRHESLMKHKGIWRRWACGADRNNCIWLKIWCHLRTAFLRHICQHFDVFWWGLKLICRLGSCRLKEI